MARERLVRVKFARSTQIEADTPLWVVIPAHNEEAWIGDCIQSFSSQIDRNFRLVVVNNASTDRTAEVAEEAIRLAGLPGEVIQEAKKGTGWACRSGVDRAVALGAQMVARTDADGVVSQEWVAQMRQKLLAGYDFVGGKIVYEGGLPLILQVKFWAVYYVICAVLFVWRAVQGRWRQILVPTAGANMAMTTELYQFVGGFSGSSIEVENEDVELTDRIFRVGARAVAAPRAVVRTSARRLKQLGLRGTLRWYGKKTETADIR